MNTNQLVIEVGQVWRHHTVSGGYRIEWVPPIPGTTRIGIRSLRTNRTYGVWPDYLRANFTLPVPGGVPTAEQETASTHTEQQEAT